METTGDRASDAVSSQSWSALAVARQVLFEACDGMTAVVLHDVRVRASEIASDGPPRFARTPYVFSLPMPVRPHGWWKQHAFAAQQRERACLLQAASLFNEAWYRARYPDIAAAGMKPLQHFLEHGSSEGHSPGPGLDATGYLARYPNVVAGKIEPWLHKCVTASPKVVRSDIESPPPDGTSPFI